MTCTFFSQARLVQDAQLNQLGNLAGICGVVVGTRTHGIAQADGDVIFVQNVAQLIEILVERVFVSGHFHPCEQQGTAARYDVGQTLGLLEGVNGLAVDACVNGHEVYAGLGMCFYNAQEILGLDALEVFFQIANGVIHRYGTDHCRRHINQLLTEGVRLAVVGQIHDGLCAVINGHANLFELLLVIMTVAGDSEIDVNLGLESFADAFWRQRLVVAVRRNDDSAAGNAVAQNFYIHVLLLCDNFHLRGDNPLLGLLQSVFCTC